MSFTCTCYEQIQALPYIEPDLRDQRANLIAELTRIAISAPDLPSALIPLLHHLITLTQADGAMYFEQTDSAFQICANVGQPPARPGIDHILIHGQVIDAILGQTLCTMPNVIFVDDTQVEPKARSLAQIGVSSIAIAPIYDKMHLLAGALVVYSYDPQPWSTIDATMLMLIAGELSHLTARLDRESALRQTREASLRALGLALEHRDAETKGHTDRVTNLAIQLGRRAGLDAHALRALRWGAYLHDIGKIGIPDAILQKPDKLNPLEFALIQMHPQIGLTFAQELAFLPSTALAVISAHHERWDGTGYPARIAGNSIPLAARLFAVCDVYDALTHHRPYKQAWSQEAALREIQSQAGQHFDPQLVHIFTTMLTANTP